MPAKKKPITVIRNLRDANRVLAEAGIADRLVWNPSSGGYYYFDGPDTALWTNGTMTSSWVIGWTPKNLLDEHAHLSSFYDPSGA